MTDTTTLRKMEDLATGISYDLLNRWITSAILASETELALVLTEELSKRDNEPARLRARIWEVYGGKSVDELQSIQQVHIRDYRITKASDEPARAERILRVINTFGELIDSKDGTCRTDDREELAALDHAAEMDASR